MNLCHEDVLADIERRVRTNGASLDEVDCRIADELGVPGDYYFAYLLVWGAIEAYREARDLTEPGWLGGDAASGSALAQAQSAAGTIGWLASTIYEQTASLNGSGGELADHAAKILGAVLQLRQNLRDLDATQEPPAKGNGRAVQQR